MKTEADTHDTDTFGLPTPQPEQELPVPLETAAGWAPARCHSLTNHYFQGSLSLCGRFNTGPLSPPVERCAGPNDCRHCAQKAGVKA